MSTNERGGELIAKYVDGIATPEEMAQLDELVASDPAVARQLVRATAVDTNLSEHFAAERSDHNLLKVLDGSAEPDGASEAPRRSALRALRAKRSRSLRRPGAVRHVRLAVAAAALLAVGIAGLWITGRDGEPERSVPRAAEGKEDAPRDDGVRPTIVPEQRVSLETRTDERAGPVAPDRAEPRREIARAPLAEASADAPERDAAGTAEAQPVRSETPVAVKAPDAPIAPREAPKPYDYDGERAYDLRFVRVSGTVKFARGDDGRPMSAVERVPLKAGDGIDASMGIARLDTPQGARVYLRRGTKLRLAHRPVDGGRRLVLDVASGAVYVDEVAGPGIDITTPFGTASPIGTRYGAELQRTRAVVVVRDGSVEVRSKDHDDVVRVETGYQTEVATGRPPRPPSRANVAAAFAWVRSMKRHLAPQKPKPRTLAFQDGVSPTAAYAGTADTLIVQSAPDSNRGGAPDVYVDGRTPEQSDMDTYALLRFDLTAIPEDSAIVAASITFMIINESGGPYPVYEAKRPWDERGATWKLCAVGIPWETDGARGAGDRGVEMGRLPRTDTGPLTVDLNREGLKLIRSWIDAPSTNHGMVIANADNSDAVAFQTREFKNATHRPKLTVTFVPAGDM